MRIIALFALFVAFSLVLAGCTSTGANGTSKAAPGGTEGSYTAKENLLILLEKQRAGSWEAALGTDLPDGTRLVRNIVYRAGDWGMWQGIQPDTAETHFRNYMMSDKYYTCMESKGSWMCSKGTPINKSDEIAQTMLSFADISIGYVSHEEISAMRDNAVMELPPRFIAGADAKCFGVNGTKFQQMAKKMAEIIPTMVIPNARGMEVCYSQEGVPLFADYLAADIPTTPESALSFNPNMEKLELPGEVIGS